MPPEARTPETVVARLRAHARALVWPSIALIVIVGAFSFFFGAFDEGWQNVAVLGAALLLVVVLWLLPLLAWLGRHSTITTRRIVLRSGFFVRVRQELLHSRGYDVTVRQNALQSMFGSGHVEINTGLEHPIILRDVPGAFLVQEVLHDLMEESINPVSARRQLEQSTPDETTSWGTR